MVANQLSLITHFFTRTFPISNLYSSFYPVIIEIQQAIVLTTKENKRKIKKLAVLMLNLSFL